MSTLPFQVDELIATLNTSHIGNEHIELAKLQAQLQQALHTYPQGGPYPTSPVQSAYNHPMAPPVNTPLSRTPSGAMWPQSIEAATGRRRRSSSVASAASARSRRKQVLDDDQDMMMEDVEEEQEVESSLYATTSPIQCSVAPSSPVSQAYSPSTYAYAITDPFLAHQLQAAEQRNRHPSYFAQIATAQQNTSPFYAAAAPNRQNDASSQSQDRRNRATHPHLTVDTSPRIFSAVR